MFGMPLSQCVETERALRRQQHGGSRASLASLSTLEKGDDVSYPLNLNFESATITDNHSLITHKTV